MAVLADLKLSGNSDDAQQILGGKLETFVLEKLNYFSQVF